MGIQENRDSISMGVRLIKVNFIKFTNLNFNSMVYYLDISVGAK